MTKLNEILKIEVKNKTCTAEPGVTFSNLVKATLKYGLVPLIVPELKNITLGGTVAGCSVESTSYKYGGFHFWITLTTAFLASMFPSLF